MNETHHSQMMCESVMVLMMIVLAENEQNIEQKCLTLSELIAIATSFGIVVWHIVGL